MFGINANAMTDDRLWIRLMYGYLLLDPRPRQLFLPFIL